jgi:plastocyanin
MRRIPLVALSLFALLLLAACASSTEGTVAPAATAPTPAPAGSAPAAGGGGCTTSSEAGAVSVGIENFAFAPAEVTAAVGETIAWTNADSAPHTATLDDDSCDTGNIAQGASAGLVFDAPGTYPYHCSVHPNMTGTITIQ